ncbi:MAG: FkbM family methyltransferase [Gemmatimonadota bacterium]
MKDKIRGTALERILRRMLGRPAGDPDDTNSDYDQQTIDVMKRVLRRDSSCIDIGAHEGDVLRHMVEIAPNGKHHAFEALPHLAAALREQFPGVNVHDEAVSDTGGKAEFNYVENAPSYSGLRKRIYDRPDPQITTIQVKVVALDDVIPSDQPIAFIKIDIEGGEYHALKGAAKTIGKWKPVMVFEASGKSTGQYGVTPAEMYGLVTQTLGYDLTTMRRWMTKAPSFTLETFSHNWDHGPVFYFMAVPIAN